VRADLEPPKRKPLPTVTLTPDCVFAFAFTFFASTAGKPQPYGFCFAELSTCLLVALSKPWQAHHKRTRPNTMSTTITPIARPPRLSFILVSFMVDLAGVEPASRTLFYPLHTAITYSIYLFRGVVNEILSQPFLCLIFCVKVRTNQPTAGVSPKVSI
jgi:hypothetical protein